MLRIRKKLKLSTRMMLTLGLVALVQTGMLGIFALHYLDKSLEEQIGQRALHVAKSIAAIPQVIHHVQNRNTVSLQKLSTKLAEETQALFVVFGDRIGIRLAHPTPERVGKPMHDDDGDYNDPALIFGKAYIRKAIGSLGASMRGKAPIFSDSGEHIVGIVSIGFSLDSVENIIAQYRNSLLLAVVSAFLISILIAIWLAHYFKKAIFGLEPEQIARSFDERNATLESIREGIVAINDRGIITTINQAAIDTLNLDPAAKLVGSAILDMVPDSKMLDILKTGKPEFDQEVWIGSQALIANRVPLKQDNKITGVVSSFRRKDEIHLLSRQITRIQQYADSLHSQAHEYSNKLHTIAGLIQIGANDEALALIGQENQDHQALIKLLVNAVPDAILAGCLLGKFNRAKELGLHLYVDPECQMIDIPDSLPREKLVSILGNLIDNALEATLDHTGSDGIVRLTMTDLGEDLIFELEDQGSGISPQQQQLIFEKGVTSKSEQGHGLGLHLVQTQLEQLNGTLTIDSVEFQSGSRITIYIPKYPDQDSGQIREGL